MPKQSKPTYTVTFRLETNKYQELFLDKAFDCGEHVYNVLVKHARKSLTKLKHNTEYWNLRNNKKELLSKKATLNKDIDTLRATKKDLQGIKHKTTDDKDALSKVRHDISTLQDIVKSIEDDIKSLNEAITNIEISYDLTEYSMEKYAKVQYQKYHNYLDYNTISEIASDVIRAVKKYLYDNGNKLHKKKKGSMSTLRGKTNKQGIKCKKDTDGYVMVWHRNKIQIPLRVRYKDVYASTALMYDRVKYCQLKKDFCNGKRVFYLVVYFEGTPPTKNHKVGDGKVAMDMGPSSIAVVTDTFCILEELAIDNTKITEDIKRYNKLLDTILRKDNPNNYNADGTIKRNKKVNGKRKKLEWYHSHKYLKYLFILKSLYRKRARRLKQSYEIFANKLLEIGTDIITEKMTWKGLQKRFGRSISIHAPSTLLSIINRKLSYIGKSIKYVNTWLFCASQYNHVSKEKEKCDLSQRLKFIGNNAVQRDLYSAFLMYNTNDTLDSPDFKSCESTFDRFLKNQDECVMNMILCGKKRLDSFGF